MTRHIINDTIRLVFNTITPPSSERKKKMKKIGKYILGVMGSVLWFFFLILFRAMDAEYQSHTHQIILVITGVCLALYIFRKTGSGAKELEKENQELKAEIQRLQQKLAEQTVQRVIDKTEQKKQEVEK